MSKTILITGCSKGFGYLFAVALAKAGFQVAATSRNLERMQDLQQKTKAANLPIKFYELDVTKTGTLKGIVSQINNDLGKIDVLINNAGYGLFAFFEHATQEEIKAQFDTNVFGLIALTQEVIPIMRKQKSGHIINISSAAAAGVSPMMGFYAASKWALEALSEAMHFELKRAGIKISLIEPGPYKTSFGESSRYNNDTKAAYQITGKKRMQDLFLKNPAEVTKLLVKVVKNKRPKFRYPVGKVAKTVFFLRKLLPGNWFLKLEETLLKING
ncbi:SDR family oxidoreductase [Candidatus Margulisiibacteriota bacterium]